jgi:uncharacterized protein (TIGR02246 family)
MTPTEIARAYFAAIHAKDGDAMSRLFAPDGEFHVGSTHLVGNESIREHFETETFRRDGFHPEPRTFLVDGQYVAVVIDVRYGEQQHAILDLFTIVDERIAALDVYIGPEHA